VSAAGDVSGEVVDDLNVGAFGADPGGHSLERGMQSCFDLQPFADRLP
jgi:hypothetical protein